MTDAGLTGRLLVASPRLIDGNFDRSVVFVIDHSDGGAVGVVLNRPSTTALGDALPEWGDRATEPPVLFIGGPVNPSAAIALADAVGDHEGWRPVRDRLGIIDLEHAPDDFTIRIDGLRVFAGYAGWSAGQLEGEINAGAWFVVDPSPGDVLSSSPERLWRDVLRRQRGTIAAIANFPADLSQN